MLSESGPAKGQVIKRDATRTDLRAVGNGLVTNFFSRPFLCTCVPSLFVNKMPPFLSIWCNCPPVLDCVPFLCCPMFSSWHCRYPSWFVSLLPFPFLFVFILVICSSAAFSAILFPWTPLCPLHYLMVMLWGPPFLHSSSSASSSWSLSSSGIWYPDLVSGILISLSYFC